MRAILLLALIFPAFATSEVELQEAFTRWMLKHEKAYEPEEIFLRFDVFKHNHHFVQEHNSQNRSYEVELNRFADLTQGEFKVLFLGYKPEIRLHNEKHSAPWLYHLKSPKNDSLDWTQKGVVTPVKNQGHCGSCCAFSTTGAVEGAVAIKHGALHSLSEQQLVDCGWRYGNMGCNGGLMDRAFKYIEAHGLCAEDDYPYEAKEGRCKASECTGVTGTKLSGYQDVGQNEDALLDALKVGPISVAIEADQAGFQLYKSGVFTGACGSSLDHGVLLVGFGTDHDQDYWKVKNSWGSNWGEDGYIRLIRNQDECGIADSASYPID
jgi:hypothetical protein